MQLIDYERFFDETENYLVPPGMPDHDLPLYAQNLITRFRGLRYDTVDYLQLSEFVLAVSRNVQAGVGKGWDSFTLQFHRVCQVACSEIWLRRKRGILTPCPDKLELFTTLDWMIAEHEKSGDTSTAIFKLLEGTEGTWVGNRFHPSKSAIDQTDFLHIFLFEAILKIAKFQREQYRKIPLQIGALARLKGKAAGKQEIRKLMGFLETRPDSRAYVVNALMESRLSPELYIRELRVTERGRVLDFALGL